MMTLLAALVLLALAQPSAPPYATAPLRLACNDLERPDEHQNVLMEFQLTNDSPLAIDRVTIKLYAEGFAGEQIGDASFPVLDGVVDAGKTATRTESVPAPPKYLGRRFDSLGCAVERIRFSNGAQWP